MSSQTAFAVSLVCLSKPPLRSSIPRYVSAPRSHIRRTARPHPTCSLNTSSPSTSPSPPDSCFPTALPSPITFIGAGGNMASALIRGLQSSAPSNLQIRAASPRLSSLSALSLPSSHLYTDNLAASTGAAMVVLCVKPNIAPTVLHELRPLLLSHSPPPLLSVIAGLTTSALAAQISPTSPPPPILRAMPNLPVACGAGVTGLCRGDGATVEHEDTAAAVLAAVGEVERVPERLFGALTAVSGAGVAYVFMMAEALADAGVAHGLPRDVARRLAAGTVTGGGVMLKGGEHPAVLRNRVESPGGVTIAGTAELEREGFRAAVLEAVEAAVDKVRKMGEE